MRRLAIVALASFCAACATSIDAGPVEVSWQVGDAVVCVGHDKTQASATFGGEGEVTLTGDCTWTGHVSEQGAGLIGGTIAQFFRALFGV